MESLSSTFEGKGLFCSDENVLDDELLGSRNLLKGWDEDSHMGYVKSGLPDMMRKPVLGSRWFENLSHDTNRGSCMAIPSKSTVTYDSLAEFGPRFSSSPLKANKHKLVPVASKKTKLDVVRESNSKRVSEENSVPHALEPLPPAKRGRITNLQSQIPVCQVLDCNKDLSLSKDYHKRHRVCDLHSKTAVVIVNGLQQRFCQQCSRFHLLPEFDKGKRSCRKRLTGHNERRRKPQLGRFLGLQGLESMNCRRYIKLEHEPCQIPQTEIPRKFSLLLPKSLLHLQRPSGKCHNGPFPVQELSADSNSSSALSLLSAQSQNFLSNSSGISVACPLIFQENQHTDLTDQSVGLSSYEAAQESFPVVPDAASSVGSEITRIMPAQNLEHYLSPASTSTVDLLQLSMHLQRVEDQKYSNEVEPETVSYALLHHQEDRYI